MANGSAPPRQAKTAMLAEREAARLGQEARVAFERNAREMAEHERQLREAAAIAEREAALEVERKAARDARYAARKARK